MKTKVTLSENQLHNIIKESVTTLLKEYSYPQEYFGMATNKGSFEEALFNAYKCASGPNKERLMQAFPEYFPEDEMNDLDNHMNWDSFSNAHPRR